MEHNSHLFFGDQFYKKLIDKQKKYIGLVMILLLIIIIEITLTVILYNESMHVFWTILTTISILFIGWGIIYVVVDKGLPILKLKRFYKESSKGKLKEVSGTLESIETKIQNVNGFDCQKLVLDNTGIKHTFFLMLPFEIPNEFIHQNVVIMTLDLIVVGYRKMNIS